MLEKRITLEQTDNTMSAAMFLSEPNAIQEGLRLGGVGVWRWKIDSDDLLWTPNLEGVHALPPGSFDGRLSSFQEDLHPEDAEKVWTEITKAVKTGVPYRTVYRTAPRADGGALWIETSGGIVVESDGTRYLTGICLDVSERIRGEQELERRLRQQRAVAQLGSFALAEADLQKVLDEAVRVAADVLAVPLSKILQFADTADHLVLRAGIGWHDGLVGHAIVGVDHESQAGFTLLAGGPVIVRDLSTETRFSGPELLINHGVRSGISVVIPGMDQRPFGVFGVHALDTRSFDNTDAEFLLSLANIVAGAGRHQAAAEYRMLMVREMSHRAGNMLQLVSSIANQTFGADTDLDTARASFSERLQSLARANYVVARGGWTATRFSELVQEALQPIMHRIVTNGRDLMLPPELSFDVGMILHELSTNSMKYGVLGCAHGDVTIDWSSHSGANGTSVFRLEWRDPHSSPDAAPKGTGFGSQLISALVERKWHGALNAHHGDGFRMTLEIPYTERSPLDAGSSA